MWQMLRRKTRLFTRDDRGLQLVELAIALPVMILLFGTVAEFGRYFQAYSTLAKGSRVAARYLATAPVDGSKDVAAKNLVVYGNLNGSGNPIVNELDIENVKIKRSDAAGNPTAGCPTTITVYIDDFQHKPLFDLGKLMKSSFTLAIDIKPSVTMRFLLTQCA